MLKSGIRFYSLWGSALVVGFIAASPVAMAQEPRQAVIASTLPASRDYYPFKAVDNETRGEATVLCAVLDTGRLSNCEVVNEKPRRYGFGGAAKQIAEELVIVDLNVHAPGEKVTYYVSFGLNGR
jgi:hypothetical protein